ncbi:hypothetical protein ACFLW3_00120 [Chloroflexota bacterium]
MITGHYSRRHGAPWSQPLLGHIEIAQARRSFTPLHHKGLGDHHPSFIGTSPVTGITYPGHRSGNVTHLHLGSDPGKALFQCGNQISSFGPAINRFFKYYGDKGIYDWLLRYKRFLYRETQKYCVLPAGRKEHRFTSREVVITPFVTKELAEIIKTILPTAMRVSQDEPM